jgi:drug/metabolite transporter (DMT)-like permease
MTVAAYGYALAALALWSTLAWASVELARVPPFLLLGAGLAIGTLPGLPFVRQWRVPPQTIALGVFGLFGFHLFLFLALRLAPPVEANLVNYLWPLLIVLLSPVLLPGTHLAPRHIVAGCMGFAGAALLVAGGIDANASRSALGFVFALGSALTWSSYSLLTRRVPPFATGAVGLFCLVSAALALACHVLFEPSHPFAPKEWVMLALIGLGPMGVAFFLWDRAMKEGDPRVIGTLAYLTPLASTALLLLNGHGSWNWRFGVATVLIVGAALWASRER